ncbi:sn-1-specific diacylglycerol lipase ABHD11 isoform X4 [Cherax quadricarinatus]
MECVLRSTSRCLSFHSHITRLAVTQPKNRQLSTKSQGYEPISMAYTSFQQTGPEKISKEPPVIIMHGLMGSKTNWKSLGKAINAKTGRHPSVVDKLFVLDVSPLSISKDISTLPRFLEIMQRIEVPMHLTMQEARKYTDEILRPAVPDPSIRQFLLTNLNNTEEGYKWRLNIEAIANNFNPFISTFPILDEYERYEGETAFIGGELSDYLRREDEEAIQELFPHSSFHYIERAGHWVHADKPNEFLKLFFSLLD